MSDVVDSFWATPAFLLDSLAVQAVEADDDMDCVSVSSEDWAPAARVTHVSESASPPLR
jgi:hypothetical protein